MNPKVIGLTQLAHVLLSLGYPDQALQRSQEALALARELAHPFSLVWVLEAVAGIHRRRGEPQAAQALAEELIPLAREQGFTYVLAEEVVRQGWDLAAQGRGEGIAQMRQGLTALQATETNDGRLVDLTLLAEAYRKVEQPAEGLKVLAEALALLNKSEARNHAAPLYRLQGELLLQSKGQDPRAQEEVEACFQRAIAIARSQGAKLLELQAVMSLSRLWQQQGKKKEAYKMLAEIYGWFTEGFDTKDLQEAKVLLEEFCQ
jgi:tetratricopeptide (TPR) repeat protein